MSDIRMQTYNLCVDIICSCKTGWVHIRVDVLLGKRTTSQTTEYADENSQAESAEVANSNYK